MRAFVALALLTAIASCEDRPPATPVEVEVSQAAAPALVASEETPGVAATPPKLGPGGCSDAPLHTVFAVDESAPLGDPTLTGSVYGDQAGFYRVKDAVAPSTASAVVELSITGPKRRKVGEDLELAIDFVNHSATTAKVVRGLDGSFVRWRYPTYDLFAQAEDGSVYRFAFTGGRCGMVNRLTEEDVVAVPAKDRWHAEGWLTHVEKAALPKPGTYQVWVVYSFCGFDREGGMNEGDHTDASVWQGVVASNALTIQVDPS